MTVLKHNNTTEGNFSLVFFNNDRGWMAKYSTVAMTEKKKH